MIWERYDVYQVLNESYDSGNGLAETWEGNLFRQYSQSQYLAFVSEKYENIGVLDPNHRHWAIIGQNRHVDVISGLEPEIRILDAR